ncbi:MAG: hypothetical protein WBQ94_02795 [Terracidiphilus sp.]
MIFLATDGGLQIILLEADNLANLKTGTILKTPIGNTIFAYTPDAKWTINELTEMLKTCNGTPDPKLLEFILAEGMKRPEVRR